MGSLIIDGEMHLSFILIGWKRFTSRGSPMEVIQQQSVSLFSFYISQLQERSDELSFFVSIQRDTGEIATQSALVI